MCRMYEVPHPRVTIERSHCDCAVEGGTVVGIDGSGQCHDPNQGIERRVEYAPVVIGTEVSGTVPAGTVMAGSGCMRH